MYFGLLAISRILYQVLLVLDDNHLSGIAVTDNLKRHKLKVETNL